MTGQPILFVHSPLVGPSSLRRLTESASSLGLEVILPDLTGAPSSDRPHEEYCRLVVDAGRQMTTTPVVVGHSGAGVFLPTIGDAIGGATRLVFLDAALPPTNGAHATSTAMRLMLDAHTEDGLLRPWLDWWPPETIHALLPFEADRRELRLDMPRLPRSFYDIDVGVPPGWSATGCAYLGLSEAYDAEVREATDRGWPTERLDSSHLGTHTDTERVLACLMKLIAQLD